MRNILKLSLLTLFLCGCARDGDQLPEVVQIKKIEPYHKVSGDDTVESIARKYGMKRSELIKLNKLEQPYHLYDGQRLIVTPKVNEPTEPDTDISVRYNNENEKEASNIEPESSVEDSEASTEDETEDEPKLAVSKSNYIWPIANGKSKISQHFDIEHKVDGITIDASAGTPVKSIADGTVVISGVPNGDAADYGVTVVIKHPSKKTMSIYAYLKEATVSVNQKVKQGTIIGKVGQTGAIATKPQLYFETKDDTQSIQKRCWVSKKKLLVIEMEF